MKQIKKQQAQKVLDTVNKQLSSWSKKENELLTRLEKLKKQKK